MKFHYIFLVILSGAGAQPVCNVDMAIRTLMDENTLQHISRTILKDMKTGVNHALVDMKNASPQKIADRMVDRYRVLQGFLARVGIHIPLF